MIELNEQELKKVEGGGEPGYYLGYKLRQLWESFKESLNSSDLQTLQATNAVSVWN